MLLFPDILFRSSTSLELPDPTFIIDPITEERASRTLYRIELLRRIREQVLPHPMLAERLKLCQPSPDLPEWWECGRHDHDLLLGASKHGVSRTDYHILNDPTLAFLEAHQRFTSQLSSGIYTGGQGEILKGGLGVAETTTAPLLTSPEHISAVAAAKTAFSVPTEEESERNEVKTGEGKSDSEIKMEMERDPKNIECSMSETPDEEKHNEGEGKCETAASQKEGKKDQETQLRVEKENQEEQKEPIGDREKTSKPVGDQDTYLTEKNEGSHPFGSLVDKTETTELPQHPDLKSQPGHKATNEDEKENPGLPQSPKSDDTEKCLADEDEERVDEDDKSEKSSQAEGKEKVFCCNVFFYVFRINA